MKICTFLWVYYGYPSSSYQGISVEQMRYNCGAKMAERDHVKPDTVAGVPDSGIAHAVGYSNTSGIPFYQVYTHMAPILYAHHSEQTESDCQDEASSCP